MAVRFLLIQFLAGAVEAILVPIVVILPGGG